MAHTLDVMVNKLVSLVTTDGRHFLGQLKGFDQALNLVLDDCVERIWSASKPFEDINSQVMLVRGDTIALLALVEGNSDEVTVAPPLPPVF